MAGSAAAASGVEEAAEELESEFLAEDEADGAIGEAPKTSKVNPLHSHRSVLLVRQSDRTHPATPTPASPLDWPAVASPTFTAAPPVADVYAAGLSTTTDETTATAVGTKAGEASATLPVEPAEEAFEGGEATEAVAAVEEIANPTAGAPFVE